VGSYVRLIDFSSLNCGLESNTEKKRRHPCRRRALFSTTLPSGF